MCQPHIPAGGEVVPIVLVCADPTYQHCRYMGLAPALFRAPALSGIEFWYREFKWCQTISPALLRAASDTIQGTGTIGALHTV